MRRIDELTRDERRAILDRGTAVSDVETDVRDVLDRVRTDGDDGLRRLTERFDGVAVDAIAIPEERIETARDEVDDDVGAAIADAAARIERFHERQHRDGWSEERDGVEAGRRFVPLDGVGVYVPGGGAAYPSTALMTGIPPRVAGVDRVVAATPPPVTDATLAACAEARVDAVYRVGGAQAIAGLAYGTETIDAVDAIVGPGNVYVTAAKRLVRDDVDVRIEFPAGPSELAVIADDAADPGDVAADMLAQCEHDADAQALLATPSDALAEAVEEELASQLRQMQRSAIAADARRDVLVGDLETCVDLVNDHAPEHLAIVTEDDDAVLDGVRHAGSIFLGGDTPVAAGDYATGTNHVLPTAGGARRYGGLSVDDFVRGQTVQRLDEEGLETIGDTVETLADAEGLTKHADTVRRRRED
jgi:histidinol dehydrogenase